MHKAIDGERKGEPFKDTDHSDPSSSCWVNMVAVSIPCLPGFQNTRLADPLAEIDSLFLLYYVAIALAALSDVACLIWRVGNKHLHILLLMMFAAMRGLRLTISPDL